MRYCPFQPLECLTPSSLTGRYQCDPAEGIQSTAHASVVWYSSARLLMCSISIAAALQHLLRNTVLMNWRLLVRNVLELKTYERLRTSQVLTACVKYLKYTWHVHYLINEYDSFLVPACLLELILHHTLALTAIPPTPVVTARTTHSTSTSWRNSVSLLPLWRWTTRLLFLSLHIALKQNIT